VFFGFTRKVRQEDNLSKFQVLVFPLVVVAYILRACFQEQALALLIIL
jgi:hypothetical protein